MSRWPRRYYRAETEQEIKRSRFITTLARADSEEEARAVIADVRAGYPDARHHCTAFIIEAPDAQPVERSSDDGEPSGTAGAPMLDVLRGAGLANVVAIVTRYFGGVLLGTGGLTRAYGGSVASAVSRADLVTPEPRSLVAVRVDHASAGRLQTELAGSGHEVLGAEYGNRVELRLATADVAALASVVAALTHTDPDLDLLGEVVTEVPWPVPI